MKIINRLLCVPMVQGFILRMNIENIWFSKEKKTNVPRPWSPDSWRHVGKTSSFIPVFFKDTIYDHVTNRLNKSAPIVFAQECRNLENELADACVGKSFVLMGGDCAETFADSNVNKVWNDFSLFIKLAFLLTFGMEKPIVKIARMGGQYAKPRSALHETINNVTLPSYQGDIINNQNFTAKDRYPDPIRMLKAYHLSVQTVNIIRAFIQGGYTNVYNNEYWSTFYTVQGSAYKDILDRLRKSLRFMSALRISSESNKYLRDISFFIGHEALLLPYEECLVRKDSLTGKMYDCSAHFLWVGERTRDIDDGPHIEFIRGISNPIGVKISKKITPSELLKMTYLLNPENIPGRLTLVIRMGADDLAMYLPSLIKKIQEHNRHVVWVCDPMHGNTKTINNRKTRYFKDIWQEILTFFEIHWDMGSIPGGVHLEMTGQNVTECLGGNIHPVDDLTNFQSVMDPRLNPTQTMEIMLMLSKLCEMKK